MDEIGFLKARVEYLNRAESIINDPIMWDILTQIGSYLLTMTYGKDEKAEKAIADLVYLSKNITLSDKFLTMITQKLSTDSQDK